MLQQSKFARPLLAVTAILSWFALATQLYLNINSNAASLPEIIVRYFSYFTIDTNLLVAICCSCILLAPSSKAGNFFSKASTQAAVAIYILVVALIYNTILRWLWVPVGLQKLVDELLHALVPLLFVIYWFLYVAKQALHWKQIFQWLIYPLAYLVFVLIRGSFANPHFYPYPFIDMDKIGTKQTLINSMGITILFILISLLFIAIAKRRSHRSTALL